MKLSGNLDELKHEEWWETKKLNKITFNVTTKCNLMCKYCYANYGVYDTNTSQDMPSDMAILLFEKLLDFGVSDISIINFFGGEPLLNIELIEAACEFIMGAFHSNRIYTLPVFTLITNGTVYSEKIESVIKKYKIHVTISMDWPECVHDKQRLDCSGKGTFNEVSRNIEHLISHIDGIEVTYTKLHEEEGITPDTIVKELMKRYSLKEKQVYITPVVGCDSLLPSKSVIFPETIISDDAYLMASFNKELQSDLFCNTGYTSFCILPDGDIYPCHMYATNTKYKLTNILARDWLNSYKNNLRRLLLPNKFDYEECSGCWAVKICHICPAKALLTGESCVSPESCNRRRGKIERKLRMILEGDQ